MTIKDGELSLAMSGAFQPFSTTDAEGKLTGFDADIATVLAERIGLEPALVQNDWAAIQQGLQSRKYDLVCGSMAITDERLQSMHFTLPYYVSGAQVFAPSGTQSLDGLRFGVTEDSTYATYMRDHPDEFPNVEIIQFGSEAEIVAAIKTNKVDAFVSDKIVGGWYIKQGGAQVRPWGPLLYQEACGIAARKESPQLVHLANGALFEIVQDGTYTRIYKKWVGVEPDLDVLLQSWGDFAADIPRESPVVEETDIKDEKPGFANDLSQWLNLFKRGAIITLELSLLTLILALLLGTIVGVGSVSKNQIIQKLAQGYIVVVRGTPLLVQLFVAYYGIATVFNEAAGSELMGAFGAALVALVINTGAYNAETIRGGILSIEKGQWEAAASLGMSRASTLRRVVLPQAFRNSVASLGNNLVVLIKDTSLVGAITLIELTYTARNIVFQTGQPFMPFLVAGVFYLVIITVLDQGVKGWERYMMRSTGLKGAAA
ncbi:MAG: ABC transporter substrate-binding protein/permease [Planctomycetes bacterium]|nr:ABC transporter substrate-binding protein/permease [Planctomycetota bacterium]